MARSVEAQPAQSRRDRQRAATVREITEIARHLLIAEGHEAVRLRAIAREMGMTAPALYRYFDSHQKLLRHLMGDILTELAETIEAAIAAEEPDDLSARFVAAAEAFRRWALAHHQEYALVFGHRLPGLEDNVGDYADECGYRFGGVFLALFAELWAKKPFPIPADDEIDPRLADQLARFREQQEIELPLGLLVIYMDSWMQLYGAVTLETFGHLDFALEDASPMFDRMGAQVFSRLGLEFPEPGDRREQTTR